MKSYIKTVALSVIFAGCKGQVNKEKVAATPPDNVKTEIGQITLPAPYSTKSVSNSSSMIDWPSGKMPTAPEGFQVSAFANDLKNPRNTYQAPNGDIFVVESGTRASRDQITIFRDSKKDGSYAMRNVYLSGLNRPYGVLVLNNYFYVANTDGLLRYPYEASAMEMTSKSEKILDLPAGGYNNHWTRNLLASPDGKKIYVTVGSGSNVAEHGMDKEIRRADILEINPDGSGENIYASGLRNPVGMDWNPANGELWTAVNERDELGDELVPDYATSLKPGGFYGWPYSYFGNNLDPRLKGVGKDLAAKAIVPDVPLGAHTASLGLIFYTKNAFPAKYKNGMFIGQHGSWNRSILSGYKVVFVPFNNGKAGKPEDFLTGFIADAKNAKVYGRPVDVTVINDGSLLVNDDSGNIIWKISAIK